MRQYDHKKIEKKWQKEWAAKKAHVTKDAVKGKENEYLLVEFPYPSGNLHVGHWYAFAMPDIYARFRRAQGKNVLYPMGFDAFGLPAENAAIKNGLNPKNWTKKNIAYMKKQLASMGASFDWSREVATIDPEYYKWTQWQFLQFYKNGLAYQKETPANWCPKDKTVLANEQVVDGKCERCGTEVEQRLMLQWNLKITDYADRLIDDLTALDWPGQIKESQRNWIGRSEGAEIDFGLDVGKKYKFVILHGYTGTPEKNWLPWAKRQLETLGHEVLVPVLPDTENPAEEAQVAAALAAADFDEHTVLVGHSLGAIVAMKALQKSGKKIARLVIVASAIEPAFAGSQPRPFHSTFSWDIDYDALKDLSASRTVLSDLSEFPARIAYQKHLAQMLDAQLVEVHAAKEHFREVREPDVLMWLRPTMRVFTTRPDTLFGATYLVLAPEHPFVTLAIDAQHTGVLENRDAVAAYVAASKKKSELERQESKEKTGVQLEGVTAINPASGERIPVYIADYVLAGYGTGAIMAVPAHDERDFEFAQKFGLPIKPVIIPTIYATYEDEGDAYLKVTRDDIQERLVKYINRHGVITNPGQLVNSGEFNLQKNSNAKQVITEKFGRAKKTYRLRDWGVSRQRYWGVPIPIIHCEKCGAVPVPDKDLPVKLPDVKDYLPDGNGKSPLAKAEKWVNVKCPQCKGKAMRETDTLDTFVDSSWYFLRYTDPKNKKAFADKKKQAAWMPVDLYSGGAEHTTMHLLYSRFWHKALYDLKLVGEKEPYTRRMNRGLILGPDGQKMSKSKGNVIDPDEVVAKLGSDAVRLYLAFIGPYNEPGSYPWNPDSIMGVRRFLERAWRLYEKAQATKKPDADVERELHKTIKKVGEDCAELKFNTAIAQMMIFLNAAEKGITKQQYATFVRILAPFAPHITEELWAMLGNKKSVHLAPWPAFDAAKLIADTITIAVQINGKTRGEAKVPQGASKEDQEAAAHATVADRLAGQTIQRAIVVPGRLVNFVVG